MKPPKIMWSYAVARFGLIPFVLAALFTVAFGSTLGWIVYEAWTAFVMDKQMAREIMGMLFVVLVLGSVLLVVFRWSFGSFKMAFLALGLLCMFLLWMAAAADWIDIFKVYKANGFSSNGSIPSPWPFVEMERGLFWWIRLCFGLIAVGVLLAVFLIGTLQMLFIVFVVIATFFKKLKTLNSSVRENAEEVVARQKLLDKYANVTTAKQESTAL